MPNRVTTLNFYKSGLEWTWKLAHVGDILPAGNRWLLAKVAEILPTPLYTELIEMLDRLEEGPFGWQQRTDAGEEEADNGDKN